MPIASLEEELLRERFEYLLRHRTLAKVYCDCSVCKSYFKLRAELLSVWVDPVVTE